MPRDSEDFTPYGPIMAAWDNFLHDEGHTLFQAGRAPLGRRDRSAFSWEYGDLEEAQADLYYMREYE